MRVTTPRALAAGLCVAAIAALIWFTIVAEGFAAPDESWFLQVVARLQSGETLYRDVYFNATPLSVYVTLGLTSIFSTELAVDRRRGRAGRIRDERPTTDRSGVTLALQASASQCAGRPLHFS